MGCTCCNSPYEHLYTRCLAFSVMPKCQYLPSATKLRRLCFYTCLSVILFTGGSTWAGTPGPGTPPGQVHPPGQIHPPGRYTPQAGAPPRTRYTHPLGQVHPPWAGTPPGQVHPLGQAHPHRPGTPPQTRYTPGPGTPPRQTATVADGTHPTGMHSCCCKF